MRTLSRLCAVGVVFFLALSPTESADWPQWLGPARNGVSPESIVAWKEAPKVVWRRSIAPAFSSPIVSGGMVFVHAPVAGKEAEEVIALDAKTGDVRWRDSYPRAKYRSQLGAGPRATPVAADGALVTFGITGTLTSYDARSGKRRWQVNPYEAGKISLPRFGVCSSPVVSNGRVVVLVGGAASAVTAYDLNSGKLAWKALDEPAGAASPTVLPAAQGREPQIVAQTTLRLVGLGPKDGAVSWEHPLVFEPSGVSPTPFVAGDSLVCTTQDTGTFALRLPKQGSEPKVSWNKPSFSGYFSTGTLGPDGTIVVVTNTIAPLPRADLRCLDQVTGDELWHQDGLGYFHVGVLATANGKLLMLDDAGNLVLAGITRKGYQELAKARVSKGTFNSPALANGLLYVRDSQNVICLDVKAGGANSQTSR